MLRIPYDNKNRRVHVSTHGEMLKAIHQLFYAYFKEKQIELLPHRDFLEMLTS